MGHDGDGYPVKGSHLAETPLSSFRKNILHVEDLWAQSRPIVDLTHQLSNLPIMGAMGLASCWSETSTYMVNVLNTVSFH